MKTFRLVHAEARKRAQEAVQTAPEGYMVILDEPTRTLEQNAALWPVLDAFSEQKVWPVNGRECRLTPEEWKDVLTASFKAEQMRMAPLIGAPGLVMLGLRTSKMGKSKFSDFLDYCHSVAADLGVGLFSEEAT